MGARLWLAALAALLLQGADCALAAQIVEGAAPAIWEGQAESGPILHKASKVSLPEEVEGLKRYRVAAVDAGDVTAKYRLKQGETDTLISLFLFKPGNLPEHKLKGSIASFAELAPSAFIWASGPFKVAAGTPLHGYKATFKTGIGPGTAMDYLYFLPLGDWTVKVRATLTGFDKVEDEERIDRFVRALPWDAIVAANGTCSGAACSAPEVERIDNEPMQTTLGQMLVMAMKFDPRQEAKLPVVARATVPLFGEADIRRQEGKDLLYVAEVKGFGTYRLIRFPDAAKALLTDGFGRMSVDKPIYGLTGTLGGATVVLRLYLGALSPDAFGAAIADQTLEETPEPRMPAKKLAARLPD